MIPPPGPRKIELLHYPESSKRIVFEPVSLALDGKLPQTHCIFSTSKIVIHVPAEDQSAEKLKKYGYHITRNTTQEIKDNGAVDVEFLYPHSCDQGFTLQSLTQLIRADFKDMLQGFIQREPKRFEFNVQVDEVLRSNCFFELRIRPRKGVPHIWFRLY